MNDPSRFHPAHQPCPACASTDAGHDCGHAALALEMNR